MSFSRTWSPLLLIAALALSTSCSSPGSPSSVQRPGLSSVVRIDALQVRECFGYPGPPCVVVPPLGDGSVVLGAGRLLDDLELLKKIALD